MEVFLQKHSRICLFALAMTSFAFWLFIYLQVANPTIFGDEFSCYALTRQQADPSFNLSDYPWLDRMRGSMPVFSWVYQVVHLRIGNPLPLAQFLNAAFLALSIPLAWAFCREFLDATKSAVVVVIFSFSSIHSLGALFVLEPLYFFIAVLTFYGIAKAISGTLWWAFLGGCSACLLTYTKPHGIVVSAWAISAMTLTVFCVSGNETFGRRVLRPATWSVGFLSLYWLLRMNATVATDDTFHGSGFYAQAFRDLRNPQAALAFLGQAIGAARNHAFVFSLFLGPIFALALAGTLDAFYPGSPRRILTRKDILAWTLPVLALSLFAMSLVFSAYVRETYRIHSRYWSYSVLPLAVAALYFPSNPVRFPIRAYRLFPLIAVPVVVAGCLAPHGRLQISVNDCPEICWIWRTVFEFPVVPHAALVLAGVASVAPLLFVFRWRLGLGATGTIIAVFLITGVFYNAAALRDNSKRNADQARLATILQSYSMEIRENRVLLVCWNFAGTGGAMFGLPRIPSVIERPVGAAILAADIPPSVTVIGTIGSYAIPADFREVWSENGYALYKKE